MQGLINQSGHQKTHTAHMNMNIAESSLLQADNRLIPFFNRLLESNPVPSVSEASLLRKSILFYANCRLAHVNYRFL